MLIILFQKLDFKNVQRRVYDALNVFAALNIVKKDKNKVSLTEVGLKHLNQENNEESTQIITALNPQKPSVKIQMMAKKIKDMKVKI